MLRSLHWLYQWTHWMQAPVTGIVCKEQKYHNHFVFDLYKLILSNPFSTASSFCHLWCVHKFTVSRETLSLTLYSWESTFTVRFDFYSAASNQVYCFTVAFQSVSLFIGYLALVCSVFRHLACTYEQSLSLLSYARASDAVSRHCCVLSRLCLEFPCLVLFFFLVTVSLSVTATVRRKTDISCWKQASIQIYLPFTYLL